jgi:hypothetical protein
VRFRPSESELGVLLYSEILAGLTNPDESWPTMFRLKEAATRGTQISRETPTAAFCLQPLSLL